MNNIIFCYTDGSNFLDQISSWAFIAVQDDKIIHQDSGVLIGDICSIRNIGGEIKAAVMAINWAKTNNYKIEIFHDLEGIAFWALGKWKRNNKWTVGYKEYYDKNKEFVAGFTWVKGHSDSKWNDAVDKLAGKTLKDYKSSI